MLQYLHVKNLALIDEIEVEFGPGLNILTGETGAGKSVILGSVSLALGGRYTKDIIRQGAEYGLVELCFKLDSKQQEKELKRLDIYPEDGCIVLSRRLKEGRSVSRINGETVQMGLLKEVSSVLIDIHGQHEHQSLLYKKNHLGILDAFARDYIKEEKEEVLRLYSQYHSLKKELDTEQMDEAQRRKEQSFLEFVVSEIEEASLVPGEDEELEAAYRRMINSKKIVEGALEAYSYTSGGGESASDALSRAIHALSDVCGYDERARELYDQLSEVDSLLNDFNRELSDYSKGLEFSEEEFYETEKRLNELNHLKTKYGNTVEEILSYCEEQRQKLKELENYEQHKEELQKQLEKTEASLKSHTKKLTERRKEQAELLGRAVLAGIRELNFADVSFEIAIGDTGSYSADGRDDVEFLVSMNPGEQVKPLTNVASGGELSRIMLAIKTVMAERDDIGTLIFDEIDVGISGRTAQKVSEKMAVIGRGHQVICITHLAQIAAMADIHFLIEKIIEKNITKTQIRRLDDDQSTKELARILGGAKITDTVLKSAVEMKELAKQNKSE